MRIIVAGGTGLLGRELVQQLLLQGHDVFVSTYIRKNMKKGARSIFIDWSSLQSIRDTFLTIRPDVLYNCIVERRVDVCELSWPTVMETNVNIPMRMAQVCEEFAIYLVHISTDYVFDGRRPPYKPSDACNPLNAYGVSKLLSELRVKAFCLSAAIVRVPVLYSSHIETLDESAVTVLAKAVMNQMVRTKEDGHSLRRPIYILDFCKYLVSLLHDRISGILHYGESSVCVTKLDMQRQIARLLNVGCEHITASEQTKRALRPYDTHLVDNTQPQTKTSFQNGLMMALNRWIHPNLFDPEKASQFFLLLDLDGTLVDTDALHIKCYREAGVSCEQLERQIRKGTFQVSAEIKEKKNELFVKACEETSTNIRWLPGAEELLKYCLEYKINVCIVTNTSRQCVNAIVKQLPLLETLQVQARILTREDYILPKPNPDGYMSAYCRFSKREPYILGFENTLVGVKALHAMEPKVCVYAVNPGHDTMDIGKEDCFLVPSLSWLWTRKPIA